MEKLSVEQFRNQGFLVAVGDNCFNIDGAFFEINLDDMVRFNGVSLNPDVEVFKNTYFDSLAMRPNTCEMPVGGDVMVEVVWR